MVEGVKKWNNGERELINMEYGGSSKDRAWGKDLQRM
jgi:hypothetical protein